MADPQVVEELRQKIARTEILIRLSEAKVAVHHEKFDDRKKGRTSRNFTARMVFKKERDGYAQELAALKFRLDAALAGQPAADTPEVGSAAQVVPVLDFVI
jgi:hypothetical protein